MKHHGKSLVAGIVLTTSILLGGCNMNQVSNPMPYERNIAEVEGLLKQKAFEQCRDEALQLDTDARSRGVAGGFVSSARVMESCLSDLGRSAQRVDPEERMRLSALSVVNFLKGGEVEAARLGYEKFKNNWPGHDLYFKGGVSFVETAEALLGRTEDQTFGQFSAMNISDEARSEMRRLNHWKNK